MGVYWSKWAQMGEFLPDNILFREGGCKMVSFLGEYPRQLDDRGRFILPAKVREKLSGTVYVAPSPIDKCLNLYPEDEWEIIAKKVSELPTVTSPGAAALQRRLFGKAMACEIDRQGRIPLNEDLLKYAGMTKDIVLVGVNSKFEIWDSEKWNASDSAYDTEMMLKGIADYEIRI